MTTIVENVQDLKALAGIDLGRTPWREITQPEVDSFANLSDDHQWIHVDVERAADGPFGSTVAHGMLTLAFVPVFVGQLLSVRRSSFGLNYGFEKVRFTAPLRVGSRMRGAVKVLDTVSVDGGVRAKFAVTIEIENESKPACYAENVILWFD